MEIGGVIVGAGTEMLLRPGDYRDGDSDVSFLVERVIETRDEDDTRWLVLDGAQRPTLTTPWRNRRIFVRISALKRSLALEF